jgi:transposase-like protein
MVRQDTTLEGKQRSRCREGLLGCGWTLLLQYTYAGQSPEVKQQSVDMAMNASGIRDTARVLHVSPTTVLKELKKTPALTQVHQTERMHDLVILTSLSTGMSLGCPSDMHINSSETPLLF